MGEAGAVSDALKAGDRVQLVGFGTFKVAGYQTNKF